MKPGPPLLCKHNVQLVGSARFVLTFWEGEAHEVCEVQETKMQIQTFLFESPLISSASENVHTEAHLKHDSQSDVCQRWRRCCFFLFPCSSDELYAYLTRCRPDLCILEGGEEEAEADRDEEEFVLIEDKEEEEEEEEVVCQRHRGSGEDWEVIVLRTKDIN